MTKTVKLVFDLHAYIWRENLPLSIYFLSCIFFYISYRSVQAAVLTQLKTLTTTL